MTSLPPPRMGMPLDDSHDDYPRPSIVATGSSVHVPSELDRHLGPSGRPMPYRRASRHRTTSISDFLEGVDRYSRRTISISSLVPPNPNNVQFRDNTSQNLSHAYPGSDSEQELVEESEEESEEGEEHGDEETGVVFNGLRDADNNQREEDRHKISNFEAITHILRGNVGIGLLTLPVAIKNSGLIFGSISLVMVTLICVHSMKLLVKASNKAMEKRLNCDYLDYAGTAESAFKDAGGFWEKGSVFIRKLLNIFICMAQIGGNAVYILFVVQNLQPVFERQGGAFFVDLDYRYYLLILLLPMIGVCSIRNLRYLSPFSLFSTILQLVGLAILFSYIFSDLPNANSVPWVASTSRWPLFFGTVVFSIDGISLVLPIKSQMKRPKDLMGWNGALSTAMNLVIILYVAMGFFGFLKYGEDVKGSVTLNLPPEEVLAQVVLVTFSVAIFFSYTLQFYVLIEIIAANVIRPNVPENWFFWTEFATRVGLNVITFALAAAVPWLDLVVALMGAIKMSTLAIMAPALIDTASNWQNLGKFKWIVIKNSVVFLFGFMGCCLGTYVSILKIIEKFQKE